MLQFEYDPDVDAAYIQLSDAPYAYGTDLDDARRVDYAADGTPRGVELLYVSAGVQLDGLPERPALERLLAERRIKVVV